MFKKSEGLKCLIVIFIVFAKDLSNMYELLSPQNCPINCPLENSLDLLVTEFEEHLQDIGLAVMQSLQGNEVK